MLFFQYTAGNYQQHNNSNANHSNSYRQQGNDSVFVLFWNLKRKKKKTEKSHSPAINDSTCTPLEATKEPLTTRLDREEKSLRHVTIVAKCLDDNKPEIHLKSKFALFQTSSIEFSGVESERTVSEFRKRKRSFCVVFSYPVKRLWN